MCETDGAVQTKALKRTEEAVNKPKKRRKEKEKRRINQPERMLERARQVAIDFFFFDKIFQQRTSKLMKYHSEVESDS